MSNRKQSTAAKQLLREKSSCELCGDKRNLEVHHIIPVVCGGSDDLNNLIVVCGVCHSKLTPRRELCNIGKNNARCGDMIHRMQYRFYELAEKLMVNCDPLDAIDWPDVFDILIDEMTQREKLLGHEV